MLFTRKHFILMAIIMSYSYVSMASIIFHDQTSTIRLTPKSVFINRAGTRSDGINGTLENMDSQGKILGNPIYFHQGIYADGDFAVVMTATYDPTSTPSIQLNAGGRFSVIDPGSIKETISVIGGNNIIEGLPSFATPRAIQFSGSSASLSLALQKELDTIMQLQSTVNLGADLPLGDAIIIDGPGTINFNSFNLILGQKDLTWSHTLRMNNARNLVLNSRNILKGQWIFNGDAHIVGNNFILDLTGGATVRVRPNTTVRMSNLIIAGLGSGRLALDDTTSKLELYNVFIDMDGNYTVTNGTWVAKGETTIITADNFLTFDNRATLTVDETTVFYNTLGFNDRNNIVFGSRDINVAQVNGGSIQRIRALPIGDFRISVNKELDRETVISPLKRLIVDQDALIDGLGFDYRFSRNPGEPIFFIDPGVRAEFTNILLKDFPVNNMVQDPTAQLIFGELSTVELGEDGFLDNTWMFEGETILNGLGKTLTLGPSAELILRPGASLLLDNMTLKGVNGSKIRCMDNTCTVSLGNVLWKQDADFTFTNGSLSVIKEFEFFGTSTFYYQTPQSSMIHSRASMQMDEGFTFFYNPPIGNRDLIQCEDSTSIFSLLGGTLASTSTGIRLTRGSLMIDGQCYITQNSSEERALSESVAIGNGVPADEMAVFIGSGAVLEILSGRVFYDQAE